VTSDEVAAEVTAVAFEGGAGRIVGERFRAAAAERGTILLLHGSGQRRHSWRRSGPALARAGWDVYAVDARGHGDSAWSSDGAYLIDDFVDDLERIVATLPDRPVVIGASLGGMTGLIGEGERGGLLRGLVLADVVARVELMGVRRVHRFMRAHLSGFATLDEAADAIAGFAPQRESRPESKALARSLRHGADGRWYWHWDPASLPSADDPMRGATRQRAAAAARRVRVPVLLVRGTASDVVHENGFEEMAQLIPHARQARVPAGHMVAGDDNGVFLDEVGDFLRREVSG
jgi:pimeloyl-ACP methyl ester carboxylesterase